MDRGLKMNDHYTQSFSNELPKLKTQREKDAVRAATLRFINELRKEIIEMSTKNTTQTVTGVVEVRPEPKMAVDNRPNRKSLLIKNTGTVYCQLFGVSEETHGSFPLKPDDQVLVYGVNAIAVATVSGIGEISYLDS